MYGRLRNETFFKLQALKITSLVKFTYHGPRPKITSLVHYFLFIGDRSLFIAWCGGRGGEIKLIFRGITENFGRI